MTKDATASRRAFLKKGALLAAPFAAAVPTVALADDGTKARLKRLEDEAAIREAYQAWLRRVNAGGTSEGELDEAIRSIAADLKGAPDALEFTSDGLRATGRYACLVEVETPIVADCTIAQMAVAQGTGTMLRVERRVLTLNYAKADGTWTIAKAEFAMA